MYMYEENMKSNKDGDEGAKTQAYENLNPNSGQGTTSGTSGNVNDNYAYSNVVYTQPVKKKGSFFKKLVSSVAIAVVFGIVAACTFHFTESFFDKFENGAEKMHRTGIIGRLIQTNDEDNKSERDNKKSKDEEQMPEGDDTKDAEPDEIDDSEDMPEPIQEVEPALVIPDGADSIEMSVEEVVQQTMPSIVAITNKSVQEIETYGRRPAKYESESAGSGIIVGQNDTELLIVTNAHVVKNADTLTVCFINDEANEAVIKGVDSKNDLAVVAVPLSDISGNTLKSIRISKIGNSQDLNIGEPVVAIGNALGYGQSVTTGIVSALDREIDIEGGTAYIQTDAAINPGNSGGALLNMRGELIGINSAKLASGLIEGMGYAIPIDTASPIIDDLMSKTTRGKVEEDAAGYLGITGFSVTEDVAYMYGIPTGVYVSETNKGSAAHNAGIRQGDVITMFDGISIDSINKLRERLDYYEAGEEIEVVIVRAENGKYVEKTLTVTLSSREGTPLDPEYEEG